MKMYLKLCSLILVILCNVHTNGMYNNLTLQAEEHSEHLSDDITSEIRQPSHRQSPCHNNLFQSFVTGTIVGSAIVWGAIHVGKRISDISEPIKQIDMDSFNGALQFFSQINVTNFNNFLTIDPHAINGAAETIAAIDPDTLNEAARYIVIAGKIVALVKDCPAAIPHLRGIYQDCFADQKQSALLAHLTIEL